MNIRRLLLYLVLNAVVSASATYAVLWYWDSTHPTGRSLIPFEDLLRSLGPGMPADAVDLAVGNLLANLLLFLPFGVALGLRFPDVAAWRLVLLCAALSVGVETAQLMWSMGRSADVTDVLTNSLGGLLGLLLAHAIVAFVRRHPGGVVRH